MPRKADPYKPRLAAGKYPKRPDYRPIRVKPGRAPVNRSSARFGALDAMRRATEYSANAEVRGSAVAVILRDAQGRALKPSAIASAQIEAGAMLNAFAEYANAEYGAYDVPAVMGALASMPPAEAIAEITACAPAIARVFFKRAHAAGGIAGLDDLTFSRLCRAQSTNPVFGRALEDARAAQAFDALNARLFPESPE